jgi:hypothetical protein
MKLRPQVCVCQVQLRGVQLPDQEAIERTSQYAMDCLMQIILLLYAAKIQDTWVSS